MTTAPRSAATPAEDAMAQDSWPTISTNSSPIAAPRWRAIPARRAANRCASTSSACSPIPDFVSDYCGDDVPRGLKVLYEDPTARLPGARAHQRQGARVAAARSRRVLGDLRPGHQIHRHDRMGARGRRRRSQARQAQAGEEIPAQARPAGIYQDGAIHSIDYPDYARFVRVTGTNLDKINRIRIDLKTGEVHQMTPQQAT